MRLFNWLRPVHYRLKPITAEEVVPGTFTITDAPCVSSYSWRFLRLTEGSAELLRREGYREVCREIETMHTIVVRPFPLWLFYITLERLRQTYWRCVRDAYDLGLIRHVAGEGVQPRLRDWRLGPNEEARSFYAKWLGKILLLKHGKGKGGENDK